MLLSSFTGSGKQTGLQGSPKTLISCWTINTITVQGLSSQHNYRSEEKKTGLMELLLKIRGPSETQDFGKYLLLSNHQARSSDIIWASECFCNENIISLIVSEKKIQIRVQNSPYLPGRRRNTHVCISLKLLQVHNYILFLITSDCFTGVTRHLSVKKYCFLSEFLVYQSMVQCSL